MSMIVQCPTLSCFMWWYFRRVFLAQKHWLSLSSFPQEFQQKIFVTACRLDYYCSSLSLFGSPHASDLFGEEVTVWCARFLLPSTRLLVLWPRPTFRLLHSLVLLAQASPLTPQNDVEVMWAKTATTTKLCTLKATTDGFCTSWNFFLRACTLLLLCCWGEVEDFLVVEFNHLQYVARFMPYVLETKMVHFSRHIRLLDLRRKSTKQMNRWHQAAFIILGYLWHNLLINVIRMHLYLH